MPRAKTSDILVATRSFSVGTRLVRKGETFRAGHPLIKGREDVFAPFTVDNEYVEAATAAPGEKRVARVLSVPRPTRAKKE